MNRIAGIETEYGCLTDDPTGSAAAVARVRNWLFENNRHGLPDVHQRDWDEPAGNGGFLFNGGRAYVDMGHLEICTPECLSLRDLIIHDQAGDQLIRQALADLGLSGRVGFIRNNIDHYSGATFGCHENYLVRRSAPLNEPNVLSLLAFLTLRVLYTGAGRIGALQAPSSTALHAEDGDSAFVPFQISQRADYINNDLFEWVQFNRAIINTRDEPLADGRRYRRLHLLHGDTSVLPGTLHLKAGTTSLVLDLLEIDQLPRVALADAVLTFRKISMAPHGPWIVHLANGRTAPALELLGMFHQAAETHFRGRDEETNQILNHWGSALDGLIADSSRLVGTVDWITKLWLFQRFVQQENIPWEDPVLKSLDLEFHHLDPERSLGLAVQDGNPVWTPTPEEIARAVGHPPENTRARMRAAVMNVLRAGNHRYFVDWEVVDADGVPSIHMLNPFESQSEPADGWMRELQAIIERREKGAGSL